MLFKFLLLFAMVAWIVKKTWETRWSKKTGRPPNELWETPPPGGWRKHYGQEPINRDHGPVPAVPPKTVQRESSGDRRPIANELRRLKMQADELDRQIVQIEAEVGMEDDHGHAASASILEGLVEWEDYVEPGFERQKKRWFKLNEELKRVSARVLILERQHLPAPKPKYNRNIPLHPPADKGPLPLP